ncbi:MAG: Na+/H+ antiporter subunit E [Verrucomicrobiota bacterium]
MIKVLMFPLFYLWEILTGSLRVGRDVLSPKPNIQPVILRVPVNLENPRKRLLLAALVSMTPGTLSIREEDEGDILVVHSLYGGSDPDAAITHIKAHYESVVARLPI